MLARWALFGSGDQMEFWEILTRFANPTTITSVHDMEEIQSDLGRVSWHNNYDMHGVDLKSGRGIGVKHTTYLYSAACSTYALQGL